MVVVWVEVAVPSSALVLTPSLVVHTQLECLECEAGSELQSGGLGRAEVGLVCWLGNLVDEMCAFAIQMFDLEMRPWPHRRIASLQITSKTQAGKVLADKMQAGLSSRLCSASAFRLAGQPNPFGWWRSDWSLCCTGVGCKRWRLCNARPGACVVCSAPLWRVEHLS